MTVADHYHPSRLRMVVADAGYAAVTGFLTIYVVAAFVLAVAGVLALPVAAALAVARFISENIHLSI